MKVKRQAAVIALILEIYICSTCDLKTTRLFVRDFQFDGHLCRSGDIVKTFENITNTIACIASYVESGCLDVFYFPGTNRCQGCYTFYSNDLQPAVSSEISLHYKPVLNCPGSFVRYNTSCYMVTESRMSWNSAKNFCMSVNAHLAILEDVEESNFIGNYPETKGTASVDDRIFFGLAESQDEYKWLTVNGDIQSFFYWTPGEPSNQELEDCASIKMDSTLKTWNDISCSQPHLAVCEMDLI